MKEYCVTHKVFGEGVVKTIGNGFVTVAFPDSEKMFLLKGFDNYFTYNDKEFTSIVLDANRPEPAATPVSKAVEKTVSSVLTGNSNFPHVKEVSNVLLGPRAQTIPIHNEHQMFEIVGYMAAPGRISSIEAEVPVDGRDKVFERLYPGQTYRPIQMGDTPSGMPNKLSPQFRINFSNIRNCPEVLKKNMGAGNSSACVARINKSKFVITIVDNYGFCFGGKQDFKAIREIAAKKGFLADFEKGLAL